MYDLPFDQLRGGTVRLPTKNVKGSTKLRWTKQPNNGHTVIHHFYLHPKHSTAYNRQIVKEEDCTWVSLLDTKPSKEHDTLCCHTYLRGPLTIHIRTGRPGRTPMKSIGFRLFGQRLRDQLFRFMNGKEMMNVKNGWNDGEDLQWHDTDIFGSRGCDGGETLVRFRRRRTCGGWFG